MMKRWFLLLASVAVLTGCGGRKAPATARAAVEQTCELLMAGEYDAVLDRLPLYRRTTAKEGVRGVEMWAEQQSSELVREMMRSYIQAFFEQEENPVQGYEIVSEEYSPDHTRAELIVAFRLRDTVLYHTFSMRRGERGGWYSNQQME